MGYSLWNLYQQLPQGYYSSAKSVEYPAFSAVTTADPRKYFSGLTQGVAAAEKYLSSVAAACPNERIILGGYSQGAMVMHRVIQNLIAKSDTKILPRIDAALLVGDGDRVRNDNVQLYGDVHRTYQGVALYQTGISHAGTRSSRAPLAEYFKKCPKKRPLRFKRTAD